MSRQSTLGGDEGMAEELARSQRSISIAEFFEKNKQMLGFDSGAKAIVTSIKEGVDNSLDATEEAGILPDIYVELEEVGDYYRLVIEDNGPGITREQVPRVFGKLLYGSRFHKRTQARGQQGIGISAAVLYSQLTSGKPARVTAKTDRGEARRYELTIDTDANEPEIEADEPTTWERPHGTRIELEMEGNMRARGQLHEYIQYTAVVNPHARITFDEPGLEEPMVFERATDELPDETEEIRPHPHGVELGTLQKMLADTDSYSVSGFLQGEFTRVGGKTAEELVDNFRDRHFGRELAWTLPGPTEEADTESAVASATANKGRAATADFAAAVAERLDGLGRPVAHGDVVAAVDAAADAVEADHGTTFGDTVREKAVAAAWEAITADRRSDLYRLLDEVTTSRKDDAAVEAMARRIAGRIADAAEEADEPRDRATRATLADWVAWAAERTADREEESFGETSREKIVDATWERARTVADDPPRVREIEDDRDTAAELLEAMRETDVLAPPTGCLAPITDELLEAGLRKEFDADFYATSTRDAEVHAGDPFVVEAGVAYGGELEDGGSVDVLRFANRVPLVYQLGACATTDVLKRINWRNYGLDQPGGSGMPGGPAVITVHVASTNVPFTSESKDAVANVEAIEDEIELALREAGRELKSHLDRQRSLAKRRKKQDVIAEVLPRMAEKLSEMTGNEPLEIDDSLARIMNNVLVERTVEDGEVTLTIHNHGETSVSPEVTDIVSEDPGDPDGATVVEMDGEWFLKWRPDVPAGERASITYTVDSDAEFEASVDGVPAEKLTVNA